LEEVLNSILSLEMKKEMPVSFMEKNG
jgi:hypothetical protein